MRARRRSGLEDLLNLASRLHWAKSLAVSATTFVALTLISHYFLTASTLPSHPTNLAAPMVKTLYGTLARFARWVIPSVFLLGAGISWWRDRHRSQLLNDATQDPAELERLSWQDFERLVGEAYRRQGYSVTELGGRGPDGGVDLILKREDHETLVQCKQWRERRVGVSTVRELHGVMAQRRTLAGIIVTIGGFTAEAQTFADQCNIRLLDHTALNDLLRNTNTPHPQQYPPSDSPTTTPSECPACGSRMIRRVAQQGRYKGQSFFGCSRYPHCRQTRPSAGAIAVKR